MKGHLRTKSRFSAILLVLAFLPLPVLTAPACLHAATTLTYEYDANGNMIRGDGKYYEYNDANQLVRVRHGDQSGPVIGEYVYDHTGQRMKKVENGVTTYYIGKHFEKQVAGDTQANTSYYFAKGERVAKKDPTGQMFYYHADHLGSANVITDASGNLVERIRYYPFGEIREGGNERYLYTGKERDKLTDLYYYEARYYNSDIKHFTQADTAADLFDPQDLNRYAYVRNNPLKYVDPTGHEFIWWKPWTWFEKETKKESQSNSQSKISQESPTNTSMDSCVNVVCRSNQTQPSQAQTYIRQRSEEEVTASKKAELVQALKVEKYHEDLTYHNVIKVEPSFNATGTVETPRLMPNEAVPISAANYMMAPYYLKDVNTQLSHQADSILQQGGTEAADRKINEVREKYDPTYNMHH